MTPAEMLASIQVRQRKQRNRSKPLRWAKWQCLVREMRNAHNLGLDAVANAIGLSKTPLWQIEMGMDPQLTSARKIARFFDVSVEDLWPKEVRKRK